MDIQRLESTATLLLYGMVPVAGWDEIDNDGNHVLAEAELYDAASRTFIRTGSM